MASTKDYGFRIFHNNHMSEWNDFLGNVMYCCRFVSYRDEFWNEEVKIKMLKNSYPLPSPRERSPHFQKPCCGAGNILVSSISSSTSFSLTSPRGGLAEPVWSAGKSSSLPRLANIDCNVERFGPVDRKQCHHEFQHMRKASTTNPVIRILLTNT